MTRNAALMASKTRRERALKELLQAERDEESLVSGLENTTVDYEEDGPGPGLVIRRA